MNDLILPNFLVVGAPKAGTTSLCFYLAQHPDIQVCDPKEPHYFCDDRIYAKGLGWYASHFDRNFPLRGEGTPSYSLLNCHPDLIQRITKDLGQPKIILMARDPLQRMSSLYSQEINNGYQVQPFNDAVRSQPQYVDGSLYERTYVAYADQIGADRVLAVLFEDFIRDPQEELDRILGFLGADPRCWGGDLTAKNQRSNHLRDTAVLRNLRKLPGFKWVADNRKRLLPARARSAMKKTLRRTASADTTWETETYAWALEQVRDDAMKFLARCNKPTVMWPCLNASCACSS